MTLARASLLFFVALAACHTKHARPTAAVPPAKLEVVAVDDTVDPLGAAGATAPADVSIEKELAPIAVGREVPVHYARTVVHAGEADAAARARLGAWLSTVTLMAGERFAVGVVRDAIEGSYVRSWVLVGPVVVSQTDIVRAGRTESPVDSEPLVSIELSSDATRRFADFTRAWVGRRIAIVLDDDVMSTPFLRDPITHGKLQLTMGGNPDPAAADRLAASLKPR